jgi:predicted aspartyl protease
MKIILRRALVATLLAVAGCVPTELRMGDACSVVRAAEADPLVRAPFEIVEGRVYVQARVNGGGPYRFAVDTGASGMGRADTSLTTALHLAMTGASQSSDGVSTATVNTVHLDRLELGALAHENLDVIARDYSSSVPAGAAISGILGRDFFADGLLVIDFPSRTLWFNRTRGIPAEAAGALAYERPFRVPVSIGAVDTTANLDTGAAVALVLPRATYDQVEATPLQDAGDARLTNGAIATGRAIVHGPLRITGVKVADVEARVSDRFPEALIGAHILQNFLIAIDQRTHRVAVCAP